jgi:hypothetical protein
LRAGAPSSVDRARPTHVPPSGAESDRPINTKTQLLTKIHFFQNQIDKQGYYWIQFGCLAVCCAMLEMQKMGTKERVAMPQNFITFRNGYLFVYSLMMGESALFPSLFG